MIYYIFFDGYGRPKKVIDSYELAQFYENNKNKFLESMTETERSSKIRNIAGHVGTVKCNSLNELDEYLDSLGDEIVGLYEGEMDARPYNF